MGETVTFALDAQIAGSKDYKLNGYTIVDTMSEGFTFQKIKSVTLDGKKTLDKADYKLKKTDEGFEVSINDTQLKTDEFYSYKDVIVTYTAKLNKDAVVGADGNPNSDSLKWVDNENKSHEKEGNDVVVYTFQLDINKVDAETDDPLEGVQFAVYASESDAKNGKNALFTGKSDDEGLLSFVGLDKGEYFVKETKSIKGYNLNTKVYSVKIEPKFSDGELTSPDDGIVEVTIKNTPSKLPKTGMVSTIMFTTVGAMLIGGAAILFLIALRKKSYSKLSH
jgi:fimbrial isopeptide formation D2 family protein/LPXTG-motif cell wall-anchored protein